MDRKKVIVAIERFYSSDRSKIIKLVAVASAIALLCYLLFWLGRMPEDSIYTVNKSVRYSFLLRNRSGGLLEQVAFSTFAPVLVTSGQRTRELTATAPYTIKLDPLGNQIMEFQIDKIPPYGSRVVTITATVDLAVLPNRKRVKNVDEYLREERFIEINAPEIKALSEKLGLVQHAPVYKTVYEWVSGHITDAGYTPEDKGALHALQKRMGDCTEFMYLTIALLRGNGVPSRGVGGFVVPGNSVLNAGEYHNWTEYYQDGRWRIMDAQKRVLDGGYRDYIAFRIFGVEQDGGLGGSPRFMAHDERLEVVMN